MNNIFNYLTIFLFILFLPINLIAQEQISETENRLTILNQNEIAPFSGVLMTFDVAAKLTTEIEFAEKSCQIEIENKLNEANIEYNFLISQCNSLKNYEIQRLEQLLEIRQQRIDFLEKNWNPPQWYEAPVFWYTLGFISSAVLIVGTAYLIYDLNY
jgi:hypothetical protein